MKLKIEESALFFEGLPEIEEVIDALYQLWNSRILDTIDFATGFAIKESFVDKFVNNLAEPAKFYVKSNEKTFLEWINDKTMVMVIRVITSERNEVNKKMKVNKGNDGICNVGKRSIDKVESEDSVRLRTRTQDVCLKSTKTTLSTDMGATRERSRNDPVTTAAKAVTGGCGTVDDSKTFEEPIVAFDDKEFGDIQDITETRATDNIITENSLRDGITNVCMENTATTTDTEMITTTEFSRNNSMRNDRKAPPVTATTTGEAAIVGCATGEEPTTFVQPTKSSVDNELREHKDVSNSREGNKITLDNNLGEAGANIIETSGTSIGIETENLSSENEEYVDLTNVQITIIPWWTKDSSLKLDRFGHKRLHVEWYRNMIGRQKEELEDTVGYCTVKYPDVFDEEDYNRNVTDQRSVLLPDSTCCACLKFFVQRERIVKVYQPENIKETACKHIFCERCAYIWFVSLPKKTEYLQTNILEAKVNKCGVCSTRGIVCKAVYMEDDETSPSYSDWVEGHTFPLNKIIFGTHQDAEQKFLNFITNRHLFNSLKKMQLKKTPSKSTADKLTPLEEKQYDEYYRAVYNEFTCTGCSAKKKNIELCHGEHCVTGCNTSLCLECSSDVVVRTFGSRKGASNMKYIQGVLECKCKGRVGRLVNLFTKQFFSKYANCTKIKRFGDTYMGYFPREK